MARPPGTPELNVEHHDRVPPRPLEALRYLAQGLLPGDIAVRMKIGPSCVSNHLHWARLRLGAATNAEAVLIAQRTGLLR